jgi:hypothetical protein
MTGENAQRVLPKALREHLDSLLWKPPLAHALANLSPTEALIETVKACVGVTEVGGDNRGTMVELFQDVVGDVQREPWCLAFLQACIAYVEELHGVRSPLIATEHCLTLWLASKAAYPAQPGDIILWRMGNTKNGHAGLITGVNSLLYDTVEGNTGAGSAIERNGDGVFAKRRARGGSSSFRELGFLRVFPSPRN